MVKLNAINEKQTKSFVYRKTFLILCLLLIGISVFGYFDFLNGSRLYVMVSDIKDQFVAEQRCLYDAVNESVFPMWSFNKGMGGQITVGNPSWVGDIFTWLSMAFGKNDIPYLYAIVAVLKIFLSGIFFYEFLKELDVYPFTRVVFSLLYAFNGHMICRGMWLHYSTEVVFVSLWLWSIERFCKNKKMLFPIALGLLFLSRNVAYVYIYSGLSFVYIIFRTVFFEGIHLKKIFGEVIRLIPFYLVGLGISAILTVPGLCYLLSSARSGKFFAANDLFGINSLLDFITTFLKTFSYSIMGTHDTMGSSGVILEDQVLYCGIFTALIFTQIFGFKHCKKQEKQVIYTMMGLIILYYVFPFARYFLNGFSASFYKTSSFWSILFYLLIGAYAVNKLECGEEQFHQKIFVTTTIVYLLSITAICIFTDLTKPESVILVIIVITLFSFAALLRRRIPYMKCAVIAICVGELCIGLKLEIGGSDFLYINKDNNKEFVYDDNFQDVVDYIQCNDDSVYRVITDKDGYNNSQKYGYMGTDSYTSISSVATAEFYDLFGLNQSSGAVWYSFNDRYLLNTIIGVKYFIKVNENSDVPQGFEYSCTVNDYEIYENHNFLPLGYVYNAYVAQTNLDKLDKEEKDWAALNGVILDEDSEQMIMQSDLNISQWETQTSVVHELSPQYLGANNLDMLSVSDPVEFTYICSGTDPQLLFSLDEDRDNQVYTIEMNVSSDVNTGGQIYYCSEGETYTGKKMEVFSVSEETQSYSISFQSEKPVTQLRIDVGDTAGEYSITDLKISSKNDIPSEAYTEVVRTLREEQFVLDEFFQNHITGNVTLEEDGILFLSIPYDAGWTLKVNGNKVDYIHANGGFMAIPLEAGQYSIELGFVTEMLLPGGVISAISIFAWAILFIYERKKKNSEYTLTRAAD